MKRLYARLVLWLIRPGLELRAEETKVRPPLIDVTQIESSRQFWFDMSMREAKDAAVAEIRRELGRGMPAPVSSPDPEETVIGVNELGQPVTDRASSKR